MPPPAAVITKNGRRRSAGHEGAAPSPPRAGALLLAEKCDVETLQPEITKSTRYGQKEP
jgi:hypothetical protein